MRTKFKVHDVQKWLREMFYSLTQYYLVYHFKMNNSGKEKQKFKCV